MVIKVIKNKYCVVCGEKKMIDTVCYEGDIIGSVGGSDE